MSTRVNIHKSIRRVITLLLCAGALALLSATVIHVADSSSGGSSMSVPSGARFAYVTEDHVVVMDGSRVSARIPRFSDAANPDEHKVIWTGDGNFVAFFSDALVRQQETSALQLIAVNVRSGNTERIPCPDCFDLTGAGGSEVIVNRLVSDRTTTFKLNLQHPENTSDQTLAPLVNTVDGFFLVSSSERLITDEYKDGGELLTMWRADGTVVKAMGIFRSNQAMPAAASSSSSGKPQTFAVAIRTDPGGCGPFPIVIFGADGALKYTTLSETIPDSVPDGKEFGLDVLDLSWGADGHFHAIIQPTSCSSKNSLDSKSDGPRASWKLEGDTWLKEEPESGTIVRELNGNASVTLVQHECGDKERLARNGYSHCTSGVLYEKTGGVRSVVADDVLSVSAPPPLP